MMAGLARSRLSRRVRRFSRRLLPLPSLTEPEHVFPKGAGAPAVQLLDVRAPVESARCGMPHAVSAPILDDNERHQVGLCYRWSGLEAADRKSVV